MSENEPRTSALWNLSEHCGDPLLFPLEVHEKYEAGEPLAARDLLAKLSRKETDAARRQRQQEALEDPYLWLQPIPGAPPLGTINGIGVRLYGRYKPAPSGHYVATHWFTILFVPIFPLGAYVVRDAPEGGWYFFGRAPLPPTARKVQLGVGALAAAGVLAVAGNLWWASRHVDVLAYNGHDRDVEVHVGDQVRTVPSHQASTFRGLPTGPTAFAAMVDGRTIDAFEADLSGHHRETVLYDVNARGAISLGWIRYGSGNPPDARLLPPERLQFLSRVDHPFREPPATKRVEVGRHDDDSLLEALDGEYAFDEVTAIMRAEHGLDAAIEVFLAEAEVRPDAPDVRDTAWQLFFPDPEVRVPFADRWRDAAPESVEAHRFWQEAHAGEPEVLDTYRALAAEHPDSALHLYLYARVLPDTDPEAEVLLQRAIELDPEFVRPWGALAYALACSDRFAEAAEAYTRYAAFGPAYTTEVLSDRIRLARLLGQPTDALIDEVATFDDGPWLQLTRASLDVWDHPERLAERLMGVTFDETAVAPEVVPLVKARMELVLCVAAGDAACARPRIEVLAGSASEVEATIAAIWLSAGRDGVEHPPPPADLSDADVRTPLLAAYVAAYGLPDASAWRDRVSGRQAALGALLVPSFDANDAAAVGEALRGLPPRDRATGYAMAAMLAKGPAAKALKAEARRYALPGDIPTWR